MIFDGLGCLVSVGSPRQKSHQYYPLTRRGLKIILLVNQYEVVGKIIFITIAALCVSSFRSKISIFFTD